MIARSEICELEPISDMAFFCLFKKVKKEQAVIADVFLTHENLLLTAG